MTRDERQALAIATYPLGTTVTTTVHGIGNRSERVTGEVVDHERGELIVLTENHGRVCVALDRIHHCTCPDDCGCRQPHRTNVCGCRLHEHSA